MKLTKMANREVAYTGNLDLDIILLKKQEELIVKSESVLHEFSNKTLDEIICDNSVHAVIREVWKLSSNYLIEKVGFDVLMRYIEHFYFVMMDDEEITYLSELGNEITIYRGESNNRILPYPAISWTLNVDVAKAYAATREGRVFKGLVKRESVCCLFFDEMEILVRPGSVHSIEDVS